ncbi:acyl-CoA dehydrogenase family protein [Microbacterium betulae]|uniref:Acyl-CoA dehydrogenase family protein n=1 Tax=Microbacterium betulae TaxID=2981139 RepID=A0AA97FJV3_9MICO|nr:acyl-CoA dehydrogenase family protein [Microbacterium sp. AB]WOF22852.1 acyl-CoA dehydrogenase family protein [Microbacterium sp. AB]
MVDTTASATAAGPGLEAEETAALRESVRRVCADLWPDATHAAHGDLAALWLAAGRQGWTGLGAPELFPAALAVQEELGRLAAPFPATDVALVADVVETLGEVGLSAGIAAATVRPVIAHATLEAPGGVVARHVEAASAATHLLVVDEAGGRLGWFALEGAEVSELPGLPVPAWSAIRPAGGPAWTVPLAEHPSLLRLRRLGLAARAAAAVGRTHELALEHAKRREQFGRPIGAFQAVSHRLVDTEIGLTAARELLAHALELRAAGDTAWQLAAEVYIEFAAERLPGLQFGAHHTLAATGYFEESEGPWLFRRVHADLAALSAVGRDAGVGEHLIDRRLPLPQHDRGPSARRVRDEVLEAFAPWTSGPPSHLHTWDDAARAVLRDRGWIGVGWPREAGGGGWPVGDVLAFSEALAYANPPLGNILMGINSIAPVAIRVGSPALRELVLNEVRKGDLSIALGYSEPGAGSDLASLRTRADRVDGGWLVNGQKMWGTCFPDSRWVLLAARTDPDATPPQAGITLFLVDADAPGITASPHTSLAGDVSATTFWDDVFVPDDRVVGEVGAGWAALTEALAAERVLIGASVMRAHRAFERLVDLVSSDPASVLPARRPELRREIGRIAVRLQAARALVNRGVRALTSGEGARVEAPMAKIAATELAEDLNAAAIGLLGPDALYEWGVDGAAGDGSFEDGLRASIMGVIAGGTGDIQRNLVARALGLQERSRR